MQFTTHGTSLTASEKTTERWSLHLDDAVSISVYLSDSHGAKHDGYDRILWLFEYRLVYRCGDTSFQVTVQYRNSVGCFSLTLTSSSFHFLHPCISLWLSVGHIMANLSGLACMIHNSTAIATGTMPPTVTVGTINMNVLL